MYSIRENRNNAPCRNELIWLYTHTSPAALVKLMSNRILMVALEQTFNICSCAFLIDNPEWQKNPKRWGPRWVPLKPQWESFMPKRPRYATHVVTQWMWESRDNYVAVRDLALAICDELDHRYGTRPRKVRNKIAMHPFPHRLPGEKGTPPPLWGSGQWLREYVGRTSQELFEKAVVDDIKHVKVFTFTNRDIPEFIRRSIHG